VLIAEQQQQKQQQQQQQGSTEAPKIAKQAEILHGMLGLFLRYAILKHLRAGIDLPTFIPTVEFNVRVSQDHRTVKVSVFCTFFLANQIGTPRGRISQVRSCYLSLSFCCNILLLSFPLLAWFWRIFGSIKKRLFTFLVGLCPF
jgi:hypothetical protein